MDNVVAHKNDIEGIESIAYHWDDNRRIELGKKNIEIAKEWIKQVF
jgi:hypothetical protein